jgi:hypothetical protein
MNSRSPLGFTEAAILRQPESSGLAKVEMQENFYDNVIIDSEGLERSAGNLKIINFEQI